MASALIGGAVLGAVAGELLKAISHFKKRAVAFKSQLEHLESHLLSLNPRCEELEELYRKLGRYPEIEEFVRSLNKGKGLVEKCSKVQRLRIDLKAKLSKDLQKLDDSILHFCNVDLLLHISTTVMRTAITTNELNKKFDTFLSIGWSSANKNGVGIPFSYASKKPPPLTVGLEVPLRELKTKLKKDTETVLVLCGPGGSGKTTLAKILCHDPEIKGKFGDNIFFLTISKVPNEAALDYLKTMYMEVDTPKLVVLDDLWLWSEHLIDRFSSEVPKLKILVTSRFELRRFRSLYKLKLLNDEDAKELFCKSAFHPNDPLPDADILDKDGNEVQLKSVYLGKYVCAENGGASVLVANRDSASGWESFRLWRVNEMSFYMRVFNKQFIGYDSDGDQIGMLTYATTPTVPQLLTILKNPAGGDRVRILSTNGKFLQAKTQDLVTADNTDMGSQWGNSDPSVFELTITKQMQGEFQVTNGYGSRAAQVMNDHWNSYIVQDDFRFIASHGLNAVDIVQGSGWRSGW